MDSASQILFKLNIDWEIFLSNPQELCLQMIKSGMEEGIRASANLVESQILADDYEVLELLDQIK